MELSRRGVVGALGSVFAIGAIGFVGASTVDDPSADPSVGPAGSDDGDGGDDDESDDGDDEVMYVEADPNAPFEARLLGEAEDRVLFDASGLVHVEGVHPEDDEHLVIIELDDESVDVVRDALDEPAVADDPGAFEIVMTLDGEEVRRIDLDGETVDALTGDGWEGVVTLPFEDSDVASDVYEALAVE